MCMCVTEFQVRCRHLSHLEVLTIQESPRVTEAAFEAFMREAVHLKKLTVRRCFLISYSCLLKAMSHLKDLEWVLFDTAMVLDRASTQAQEQVSAVHQSFEALAAFDERLRYSREQLRSIRAAEQNSVQGAHHCPQSLLLSTLSVLSISVEQGPSERSQSPNVMRL